MPTRSSSAIGETDHDDVFDYLDEPLIEQIWRDLEGQVSREQVRQVATGVAARFHTATVTAFIPIFIHRQTREKLKKLISAGQLWECLQ